MNIVTLNDVEVGQKAVVESLNSIGSIRRRLLDIGLVEGTVVECVGESPQRDPKAYLVRGAVMAIRSEDAQNVKVTYKL